MGKKAPTSQSGLFGGGIGNGFRIPSIREYSQSFAKHPFGTMTELADPFGIDPLAREVHNEVAKVVDPYHEPGYGPQPDMAKITPPDRATVAEETNKNLISDLDYKRGRRSAANTLFSGGQGILDRPTPASHVLLGS